MHTSDQTHDLAAALAKAQGEMGHAHKDRQNPHFKSSYATLASCIDACREPLAKHGLAIIQGVELTEHDAVSVTTRLMHASGQWIEAVAAAKPRDLTPQSVGSVVTYLRRYSLMAMVGLAPDDDDGNEGQGFAGGARAQQRNGSHARPATDRYQAKALEAKAATAGTDEQRAEARALYDKLCELSPNEAKKITADLKAQDAPIVDFIDAYGAALHEIEAHMADGGRF